MDIEVKAQLGPQARKEELLTIAVVGCGLLTALAAGANPGFSIALALAGYAIWHLRQLAYLLIDLRRDRAAQRPVQLWGLWREVATQIAAIRRRQHKRKRRLRRMPLGVAKILEALPEAVILLNQDREITWCNPQAISAFGLVDPHAPGRRLVDLVDHPILRGYLEAQEFARPLQIEAPGEPAKIVSISVLPNTPPRARSVVIARDITRQYHANRSQHDFALNVAHELRTPLTVLHGYLETLLDVEGELSPKRRPILQMIGQTLRMQAVIQDLATLSRLEDGREALRYEPVDLPELVRGVVEQARQLTRDSRHEFRISRDPSLVLLGDEALLRTAISNLVFNAVRHTPVRTLVEIQWREEAGLAVLEVRDNGAGIPARHLSRLTERFYRVDSGRSRDSGSSGLGLAIVQQILDLHGAQLTIQSEEGFGSRFRCLFPRVRFNRVSGPAVAQAPT